jgi:hypothetical protein
MGEMIITPLDSPWELTVVQNDGEIPAEKVTDEIAVPTAPLLTDIKAQLMTVPRTLTYIVGWRALVWQNKETGRFQDLTEEQWQAHQNGNIVAFGKGIKESDDEVPSTSGDTGSPA